MGEIVDVFGTLCTDESKIDENCCKKTLASLPFVIKIFILFIFEWPFYTGFTVLHYL